MANFELQIANEDELTFDGKTCVTKTGRTTSKTKGRLARVVELVSVPNRAGVQCYFEDVYSIHNLGFTETPFFKPGDSGSGVYIDRNGECNKALGIAFAFDVEEVETYVCSIHEIVRAFNITVNEQEPMEEG